MLVAFTVTSFYVVMQGSFLTLSSPNKKSSTIDNTNTKNNSKSKHRERRLFHRYMMENECNGKEIILDILRNNIDVKRCKVDASRQAIEKRNLPSSSVTRRTVEKHVYGMTTCQLEDLCPELLQWKQIKNAYGPLPVILGTDSCSPAPREGGDDGKQRELSSIDIVGLFSNAGTDLLATTLNMNYPHLNVRNLNFTTAVTFHRWQEDTLRMVVVRDPFRWMAAMVSDAELQEPVGLFSATMKTSVSNLIYCSARQTRAFLGFWRPSIIVLTWCLPAATILWRGD
jgi:hypothetical protein